MKVIAGVHAADSGEFKVDGEPVHFRSARDARARGIGMVHQELSVAPDLSVAENVFLGAQPVSRLGTIAWGRMAREARRATEEPRPRHRPARAARRFSDRRAATRRTRARAVLRRAHHHSRRADLGAVAARDRAAVRRCCGGCARAAAASSSSRIFSTTSSKSPTRFRCSATAAASRTREVGPGRRQGLDHREHDRRRPRRTRTRAISHDIALKAAPHDAGGAGGGGPDAGAVLPQRLVPGACRRGARASTASWAAARSSWRGCCSASSSRNAARLRLERRRRAARSAPPTPRTPASALCRKAGA